MNEGKVGLEQVDDLQSCGAYRGPEAISGFKSRYVYVLYSRVQDYCAKYPLAVDHSIIQVHRIGLHRTRCGQYCTVRHSIMQQRNKAHFVLFSCTALTIRVQYAYCASAVGEQQQASTANGGLEFATSEVNICRSINYVVSTHASSADIGGNDAEAHGSNWMM